jgi:DNA-binding LacI/PurR family transcriptional regulator
VGSAESIYHPLGTTVRRTATIRDVAQLATVSPTTVSLVLNNVANSRIPAATAIRVRAAATKLGYAPNPLARGLRRRRTDVIALISDTITTTPFAVRMIEAVEEVVRRNGLLLLLVNTGADASVERAVVNTLGRQQVDGFLYACMHHRIVDPPEGLGHNVVLLNARTRRGRMPAVLPDDRGGARVAVTELLEHGHRRIGFVNDARRPVAAGLRLSGYRDALKAYGVRFDRRLVLEAEPTLEASAAAALQLYDRTEMTALFCFNDRMAVGAYRGLRHRGCAVPHDVSVVGFDDQEFVAAYAEPPLTTVALPHYAMGEWAARTLVDLINGRPAATRVYVMRCELVRRDSVGRAASDRKVRVS